ncbi:MAG: DUF1801 domain-containing protein [Bacteroidota bacterium]
MNDLEIKTSSAVDSIFENYPKNVREKMSVLRNLVIETAKETEGITQLEEALKWGEPSFLTKKGSTIRMDWKSKTPDQYAMYFQCTSRLVETFKMLFGDAFNYEGKRALVFPIDKEPPREELKHCIRAALLYHSVKHLPTLGI